MTATTTTPTTETPTIALARIVQPLDEARAATVREAFGAMFDKIEAWQAEAAQLVVTSEDQTGKMKRSRLLRLEIRGERVGVDKKRKALKAGVLVEGRAIDGAYAIFEALTAPLEKHLLEQEQFAERAEAARRDALRDARVSLLEELGVPRAAMPAELGTMDEQTWATVRSGAAAAKRAREEEARAAAARAEADRVEREKAEAERVEREKAQREENERLRAEAAKHEAERKRLEDQVRAQREKATKAERERLRAEAAAAREKADREAADARAQADREAREKAERERAEMLAAPTEPAPSPSGSDDWVAGWHAGYAAAVDVAAGLSGAGEEFAAWMAEHKPAPPPHVADNEEKSR